MVHSLGQPLISEHMSLEGLESYRIILPLVWKARLFVWVLDTFNRDVMRINTSGSVYVIKMEVW